MPRSKKIPTRKTPPDLVYKSPVVTRLINQVMRKGKKDLAHRIVYQAMKKAAEKAKKEPLEVLIKAVANVAPSQEVRPRRVGGGTYQIPTPVKGNRKETLALRWITAFAKSKKGRPMEEKLADELYSAYQGTGDAVKKKENTHRMAEANRAFAHFRW